MTVPDIVKKIFGELGRSPTSSSSSRGTLRAARVLRAVPRDRLQLRLAPDGGGGHLLLLRARRRRRTRWCWPTRPAQPRRVPARRPRSTRRPPSAGGTTERRVDDVVEGAARCARARYALDRLQLREAEPDAAGRARRRRTAIAATSSSRSTTTPATTSCPRDGERARANRIEAEESAVARAREGASTLRGVHRRLPLRRCSGHFRDATRTATYVLTVGAAHARAGSARERRRQPDADYENRFTCMPAARPVPPAAHDAAAGHPGRADRGRRRRRGRGDLHRRVRPREGAVPLGPRGQERREQLVLDPRRRRPGPARAGARSSHPAHRPGGDRRLPRGRPRPADHHRPRLQRRADAALRRCRRTARRAASRRAARQGRRRLQRDPLRGQEGQRADLRPRPEGPHDADQERRLADGRPRPHALGRERRVR